MWSELLGAMLVFGGVLTLAPVLPAPARTGRDNAAASSLASAHTVRPGRSKA